MYMYITFVKCGAKCIPLKQICWSGANSNNAGFKNSGLGSDQARELRRNNSQSTCSNCANEPDESCHSSDPEDEEERTLKQLYSPIMISPSRQFAL